LISSPESPQPLHVVLDATRGWVERLGAVWVLGQVIELNRRAGHLQFITLRDATEEVSVSVSTTATVLDTAGPIAEGATVAALLKPAVWRKSGRLVFDCTQIQLAGEGRLLAQLEQRKRMLQAEGLFSPELKRKLPFLPNCIGLITGYNSDAERDVLENTRRRWPGARFRVINTHVQGAQAVPEIIPALQELDADAEVDVIVIARGGGSLEDLLPFSDEALARAVFAARTPVVSAIGHEPDNPILDLVADVRASTPTDAAKLLVPDAAELRRQHQQARGRLRQALVRRVRREQAWLQDTRSRPVLRDPAGSIRLHQERVRNLRERVRALSPQATLGRGYTILVKGLAPVTSPAQVSPGDTLTARVKDGRFGVQVVESKPEDPEDKEE
jgi:exodeoxyribonuclease VII large subunit